MRSNAGRGPAKSNGTSAMVLGHMWKYHLNFFLSEEMVVLSFFLLFLWFGRPKPITLTGLSGW